MRKLIVLIFVLALCVPFAVEAQTDTLLFVSGFESGNFDGWRIGGNPYDAQILPWYLCPLFTGIYCARMGAYGVGQRSYLIDTHPSSSHSELVFQWYGSVNTRATPTQSASIFRLVTDGGVLLAELRTQWSNSTAKVRLSCRDADGQKIRYSSWLAMPKSWNGLFAAQIRVGWRKGPTNAGNCWMDMTDSAGNRKGTGMLISTGGYSAGKVFIGVIANPSSGKTEHYVDDYSDHWLH